MPWKPSSGCNAKACQGRAVEGERYCKEHAARWHKANYKRKDELRDEPSARLYNSTTWRKIRAAHMAAEPVCRECGRLAHMVDHIIPIRSGGSMTDRNNMQSLCNQCHARKRGRESHGNR